MDRGDQDPYIGTKYNNNNNSPPPVRYIAKWRCLDKG